MFGLFYKILRILYNLFFIPKPPNLLGDREVEYAFVASQIPNGHGNALDFGSGRSNLSLMAALSGYRVTATDLTPNGFMFKNKNIKFLISDILKEPVKKNYFDLVINCSSIEHVGLSGRYGVFQSEPDGDLLAMSILRNSLKKQGIMILTIPVGIDTVVGSKHRVYGINRLTKLLKEFSITKEIYWTKGSRNIWVECSRKKALSKKPSDHFYNLGCFVLSPKRIGVKLQPKD